jgi:outer membrane protein TolC
LALLTELLDADNMKLTAELDLVNARVDLIGSYYQLRYITNSL